MLGLEGEPALVVGGGYGMGRETALLLAKAGARVAIADKDGDRARAVAAEVGGHAVQADVLTAEGATAAVEEAHALLGGLTRMANIVGLTRIKPYLENTPEDWAQQLQLNLVQQMMVAQAAGRRMIEAGGGAIALVSSVASAYGMAEQAGYSVSKAGVNALARVLAAEWGPHGVRVNVVAPDLTATRRLLERLYGSEDAAGVATLDAFAAGIGVPMARVGRAHEMAGPLVFLLSDLSSYMTGQVLVVDGGTMIRPPYPNTPPAKQASA